jgi:hypothetical protein
MQPANKRLVTEAAVPAHIENEVTTPGTPTQAALSATYAQQWKPTTAYAAGQPVVNPTGDVVTSKTAHTSGASYNPANWNLSASYATPARAAAAIADAKARQRVSAGIGLGLVPVVDRQVQCSSGYLSSAAQGMFRWAHTIRESFGVLRLVFTNYHGGPAESVTGAITVKASLEAPVNAVTATRPATTTPVLFSGVQSISIPYGGTVISDPIYMTGAKGQILYSNVFVDAGTGNTFPTSGMKTMVAGVTPNLYEGGVMGATVTDTTAGGVAGPSGYVYGYGPSQILGGLSGDNDTLPVSIFGAGDSIMFGATDDVYSEGFMGRASRAAGVTFVNAGHPSEKVSQVLGSNYSQRIKMAAGCTVWICEYGRNDLPVDTLAVFQANLIQFWRMLAAVSGRGYQTTLPPNSTSTDEWSTLSGQTADTGLYGTQRVQFNAWLRDGAPISNGVAVAVGAAGIRAGQAGHPLKGYLEVADAVESARDSGKFKAPLRSVSDAAITSGTRNITSATANFTSADIGKSFRLTGAGASGASIRARIISITNATTAVYEGAAPASATVSAQKLDIGTFSQDGTHFESTGHQMIADALNFAAL